MMDEILQENEGIVQMDLSPEKKEEDELEIMENVNFDLVSYIRSFSGHGKVIRLQFIADHCPALRIDALMMILDHVETTYNTSLYKNTHKLLKESVAQMPECDISVSPLDVQWIHGMDRKLQKKLDDIEEDLKHHKINSMRECIRRDNDELADQYLELGDLTNSLKCYSKSRDYCNTPKDFVYMCLNVVKISIYLENWQNALSHISKAENIMRSEKEDLIIHNILKSSTGLVNMVTGKYRLAAKSFIESFCDSFCYSEVLSVNNVATYGALCALATFDRDELRDEVVTNKSFKMFLESEPKIRQIVNSFNQLDYKTGLKIMDDIKNNLLLDIYLKSHVTTLYRLIRNRALCQYFRPYISVDMNNMADSFNTNVKDLEEELMYLILTLQISGRIDSHNKILNGNKPNRRTSTFKNFLQMAEERRRTTNEMVLRSALIKYQIFVRCPTMSSQVRFSDIIAKAEEEAALLNPN